jgi:hypothetical protein
MSQNDEEKITSNILDLEKKITDQKKNLSMLRLCKLLGISEQSIESLGIKKIKFDIGVDTWNITYIHHTNKYDENDYDFDSDSEGETEVCPKTTQIRFGKTLKYYIKRPSGIRSTRFKLYRNSKKELRVINTDYDIELDMDEQMELIHKYSENKNIPEWMALKVIIYICENEWQDNHIINYFKII